VLVGVARKGAFGIDAPRKGGFTYDWRAKKRSPENTRGVEASALVLPVREALERSWPWDAYLTGYILHGPDGLPLSEQPRINKGAIPWLTSIEHEVRFHTLIADVDTPGHVEWTPDALDDALEIQHAASTVLRTCGIYYTARGWHIVQPLNRSISIDDAEATLLTWLTALRDAGIPVDEKCKDWTRLQRAPKVFRADGLPGRVGTPDLEYMRAIAPPKVVKKTGLHFASQLPRAPVQFVEAIPVDWESKVQSIARACVAVPTEWHTLFLAIAGTLIRRGVNPGLVPSLIRAISNATGNDTRTESRVAGAHTTVKRWESKLPFTATSDLRREWPEVAEAVLEATAKGRESKARKTTKAAVNKSALQSSEELMQQLRIAPAGVTLIGAECGLGKTKQAIQLALERASTPYADGKLRPRGSRAPANSKTAIAVPFHDLALQICRDIWEAGGIEPRRLFGPLALKEDGKPVCKFHETAGALQEGGLSIQWELCDGRGKQPCPYRATCPAAIGAQGPDDSRIIIGTHQLLRDLSAAAGSTGVVVIDEPPELTESFATSTAKLATAATSIAVCTARFADAMKPAVQALTAWAVRAEPETQYTLLDAVRVGLDAIVQDDLEAALWMTAQQACGDAALDVLAVAKQAREPGQTHNAAPPVQWSEILRARGSIEHAKSIATVTKLTKWIERSVHGEPIAWRIDENHKGRFVVATGVRSEYAAALKRDGATVLLDAGIDRHVPVVSKFLGYSPPLLRFEAADGAPIERTLYLTRSATRHNWFAHGHPVWSGSLLRAIDYVLQWAGDANLALITFRSVRLGIEATLRPDDESIVAAWKRSGGTVDELEAARQALAPLLQRFRGTLLLGHFGAVRGLNSMADADCLATLGDPWPNLGEARNAAAFVGIPPEDAADAAVAAELEQAQGRLRVVHRTRPGRALHYGSVRPGGSGWRSPDVRLAFDFGGRPKGQESRCTPSHLQRFIDLHGGVRAAAKALHCDDKTVRRYVSGERVIAPAVAELVLSALNA
jgi:hypothetical protein